MKRLRNIILYIIAISAFTAHNCSHTIDAMGEKGVKRLGEVIEKSMPVAKDTSAAFGNQFGAQFGTGALAMIGAAATKAAAAIKVAVIAIASAPAAPYVAGGIVVSGGIYSIYRVWNPTAEELQAQKKKDILIAERDLTTCLKKNLKTISQCNNFASAYAMIAGADAADKLIYAAKRYPVN